MREISALFSLDEFVKSSVLDETIELKSINEIDVNEIMELISEIDCLLSNCKMLLSTNEERQIMGAANNDKFHNIKSKNCIEETDTYKRLNEQKRKLIKILYYKFSIDYKNKISSWTKVRHI